MSNSKYVVESPTQGKLVVIQDPNDGLYQVFEASTYGNSGANENTVSKSTVIASAKGPGFSL